MTLATDDATLLDDAGAARTGDCVGAWAPAQRFTYAASRYSGVAVQSLRARVAPIAFDVLVPAEAGR